MFTIHKTDTGAVTPFEYMTAAPGAYKIGQFLRVSDGKLTTAQEGESTHYLCMTEKTLAVEEVIPVVRVNKTMILKASNCEAPEGFDAVGAATDVSNDGCALSADGMGISVEIVAIDDDAVYVRLK